MWHRYCLLKHVIEGKIERRMGVMVRRGRRRTQLLDGIKETKDTEKWKRKQHIAKCGEVSSEESMDMSQSRLRNGRKKEWMDEWMSKHKFTPKSANYRTVPMRFNTPTFFYWRHNTLLVLACLSIHSHLTPNLNLHFSHMVYVDMTATALPRS